MRVCSISSGRVSILIEKGSKHEITSPEAVLAEEKKNMSKASSLSPSYSSVVVGVRKNSP